MRTLVSLLKPSESTWNDDFSIENLKPPEKVCSIIEVKGEILLSSLSSQNSFYALICRSSESEQEHDLYVLCFKRKITKLQHRFSDRCHALHFHPSNELQLFLASDRHLLIIDIENGNIRRFSEHASPISMIFCIQKTHHLVTSSTSQVLLWDKFKFELLRILRVDKQSTVIWAGESWSCNSSVVAFNNGTVMTWGLDQREANEGVIQAPEGLQMSFVTFALSKSGTWLVGCGNEPILLIYCLTTLRAIQVCHFEQMLSSPVAFSDVIYLEFIPAIHPAFQESILLSTARDLVILDFSNMKMLKTLKSQHHFIRDVHLSMDGFFISVAYSNGSAKLYTTLSFFPPIRNEIRNSNENFNRIQKPAFHVVSRKNEAEAIDRGKSSDLEEILSNSNWLNILGEYKEYPHKYRQIIWANLLKLPRNYSIMSNLLKAERRAEFTSDNLMMLSRDSSTLSYLKSTLGCLYTWSPFLNSVKFVPEFVLPFVRVFSKNILFTFEIMQLLLSNHCLEWYNEESRRKILSIVEQIVHNEDPQLFSFFVSKNISIADCAWIILKKGFSKIFCVERWLILWDHIVSSPPSYLLSIGAAFILCHRKAILMCTNISQIRAIMNQESWLSIRDLLKKNDRLFLSMPLDANIKMEMDQITYIPQSSLLPPILQSTPLANAKERSTSKAIGNKELPRKSSNIRICQNSPETRITRQRVNAKTCKDDVNFNAEEDRCLHRIAALRKTHAKRAS